MPERKGDRVIETPTEARAGAVGQGARYVLTISTVAAAVLLVGVFLYFFV